MNPFCILMLIFGGGIFLYGACVMIDKHPFIPRYYKKTISKSYRQFIGRTLMLVSISPILGGLVSCLGDSTGIIILSGLVIILSFIFLMFIAIKFFKK